MGARQLLLPAGGINAHVPQSWEHDSYAFGHLIIDMLPPPLKMNMGVGPYNDGQPRFTCTP